MEEQETAGEGQEERVGWYKCDNRLMAEFAAQIGVYGIAVYNNLAWRSNPEGESWPSVERIASDLNISVRQVQVCLRILEVCNLIETKRRLRKRGGGYSSNLYKIVRGSQPEPEKPR